MQYDEKGIFWFLKQIGRSIIFLYVYRDFLARKLDKLYVIVLE